MKVVLDTHALLWLVLDERRLGTRAARFVDRARPNVAVSAFSFREIATLVDRGRLKTPLAVTRIRAIVLEAGVSEVAVDGEIALLSAGLRGFHGDPVDRIIVATALHHGAIQVTADAVLLTWKHGPKVLDATV